MSEPASAVESEFGVPIPGTILPEEQWARTAIKRLPPPGPLDFTAIFGRTAPVVLDLGCGNGRSTLTSALARPEMDHFAVDILPVVIRYFTRRANQRGLHNVRIAVIGGRELLRDYIAAGSVAEIHCYHPQPYYDRREIHKRLIVPEFLALVHRALQPGGRFVVQTDNPAYAKYMQSILPSFFVVEEHPQRWPDAPQGRTRREILALQQGLPVFRAKCRRRDELTEANLDVAVESLPRATFDADRRLQKYDRLESGESAPSTGPSPRRRRSR
ncbi:MAG TPA: methyltransferase domain-containing protein [Planctomycetaceae bacterium]|nr:methyltransferase domain-containing protein [Planctomycetaceae bacterium]